MVLKREDPQRKGRAQMFRNILKCSTWWDGGPRGGHGRWANLHTEASQIPWASWAGGEGVQVRSEAVWVDWNPGWMRPGDRTGHSQDKRFKVEPLGTSLWGGLRSDRALLKGADTSRATARVWKHLRKTRPRTKVPPNPPGPGLGPARSPQGLPSSHRLLSPRLPHVGTLPAGTHGCNVQGQGPRVMPGVMHGEAHICPNTSWAPLYAALCTVLPSFARYSLSAYRGPSPVLHPGGPAHQLCN